MEWNIPGSPSETETSTGNGMQTEFWDEKENSILDDYIKMGTIINIPS